MIITLPPLAEVKAEILTLCDEHPLATNPTDNYNGGTCCYVDSFLAEQARHHSARRGPIDSPFATHPYCLVGQYLHDKGVTDECLDFEGSATALFERLIEYGILHDATDLCDVGVWLDRVQEAADGGRIAALAQDPSEIGPRPWQLVANLIRREHLG